MAKLNQFLQNRVASKIGKVVERGFAKKPLSEQVKMMQKLILTAASIPGSSVEKARTNVRANLLKRGGLPSDIRGMAKKGMTKEGIKSYYWDCPEFVAFWSNDLQMDEANLDYLISSTLEGGVR